MFDWGGEFNTFVVPFAPFGAPTVNRRFSPDARDFIRAIAYGAGVDVDAHAVRAVRRDRARRAA